jgi:deoxycytidylate deaminase
MSNSPAERRRPRVAEAAAGIVDTVEKLAERRSPELVVGLVGAVGAGVTTTADEIEAILRDQFGYEVHRIKVSKIIEAFRHLVGHKDGLSKNPAERIRQLQDAGNALREKLGPYYLAEKCIEEISVNRTQGGYNDKELSQLAPVRRVTIVDSLKNPGEAELFHEMYPDHFWLFGVFSPEHVRKKRLLDVHVHKDEIDKLIRIDEEDGLSHGQKVRRTFDFADFFVRNDQDTKDQLRRDLLRFLDVLFDVNVNTPTSGEAAMAKAAAAARQSACLSRQVGAALMNASNVLLSTGWNDVPRAGGGLYSSDTPEHDNRCFKWKLGQCHNDERKDSLKQEIIDVLTNAGVLAANADSSKAVKALEGTRLQSLIEFSRSVHAELSAIVNAARVGAAGVQGSRLFVTTYPCHNCARHIVAAGISRVVYIEPYPKSLAIELHDDSVAHVEQNDRVAFVQYQGVSPRHYERLFSVREERKDGGKKVSKERKKSFPAHCSPLDNIGERERSLIRLVEDKEKAAQ